MGQLRDLRCLNLVGNLSARLGARVSISQLPRACKSRPPQRDQSLINKQATKHIHHHSYKSNNVQRGSISSHSSQNCSSLCHNQKIIGYKQVQLGPNHSRRTNDRLPTSLGPTTKILGRCGVSADAASIVSAVAPILPLAFVSCLVAKGRLVNEYLRPFQIRV